MRNRITTVAANLLLATGLSGATVAHAAGDGQDLVDKLRAVRPDIPVESVSPTPIDGIYALELPGGQFLYGTADGKYFFAGDLFEVQNGDLVNRAEVQRTARRKELIDAVAREDMVIFSPEGPTKAAINVFTDVDCTFCQRLHQEVPKLNEMGIEVRYLAYPRGGIGSAAFDKMVSAWCAKDPNTAITRLKNAGNIPNATCENPVAQQYELGLQVGVQGTPTIIAADGEMLRGGYKPADEIAQLLGVSAAAD